MTGDNYILLLDILGIRYGGKENFQNNLSNGFNLIRDKISGLMENSNITFNNKLSLSNMKNDETKNKDYLQLIVFILTIILVITLFNLFRK